MASAAPRPLYERLFAAVRQGDEALATAWLAEHKLSELTQDQREYLFRTACSCDTANVAKTLLDNGFDPRAKDRHQRTTLHVAVACRSKPVAELVIGRIPDRDKIEFMCAQDDPRHTALHIACQNNFTDLADFLLASMPSDNRDKFLRIPENFNRTALHVACGQGSNELVQLLLANISDCSRLAYMSTQDLNGQTALHLACESGTTEVVELLIASIPDKTDDKFVNLVDNTGMTALHIICLADPRTHDLERVTKCLLDSNASRDAEWFGHNAEFWACAYSNVGVMRVLLQRGSAILGKAIFGADQKQTCLHLAATRGRLECVEWLLSNMDLEDVQKSDGDGCTAWERAAFSPSSSFELVTAFTAREQKGHLFHQDCKWFTKGMESFFEFELNNLPGLVALLGNLVKQDKISINAAIQLVGEIGHLPRLGNGFHVRPGSCDFKQLGENNADNHGMETKSKSIRDSQDNSSDAAATDPSDDGRLPDYMSIAMPYLDFETVENLNHWREPDPDKALAWQQLSQGWEYCCPGGMIRDAFFPPLTLDEYCCQALSREALDRRNCDQVILSVQVNAADANPAANPADNPTDIHPAADAAGAKSLGSTPSYKLLVVVRQMWLWKVGDVLIESGGRDLVESRFPKNYETESQRKRIGIILTELALPPRHRYLVNSNDPLFLMFEQAIVAVSEEAETYLRDIRVETVSIDTEKKCLHRIIDIQDELSMIKRVILQQEMVWKKYAKKAWPFYWAASQDGSMTVPREVWDKCSFREREEWDFILGADSNFKEYHRRIAQLDEDAQRVERSVAAMLDLKSKHASLRESHASAIMSAAVVGFTVVTIIFTPMSYMATLFALPINNLQDHQDISRFTNESGAYTSRYVAGSTAGATFATLAVTIPCMWLSIAYLGGKITVKQAWRHFKNFLKALAWPFLMLYRCIMGITAASQGSRPFLRRKNAGAADMEKGD